MAVECAVGSFQSATATGAQSVATLSFQPKIIFFFGTAQGTAGTASPGNGFVGMATSSSQQCVTAWASDHNAATANSGQSSRTTACIVQLSNGTPQLNAGTSAVAAFTSFNSNGFTITWSTVATVAFTVNYIAYGGADITNVFVGQFNHSTVASTSYSVGFQPDALIFLENGRAATPTEAVDAHVNLGFATRTAADLTVSGQWGSSFFDNDATTSPDLAMDQFATKVMPSHGTSSANAQINSAAISAFTATGYTLTYSAWTGAGVYFVAAIKGGQWKTGVTTQTTAGAVNPGFQPRSLMLLTTGQTTDASVTASGDNYGIALGASDGTNHRSVAILERDGTSPSLSIGRLSVTQALSLIKTSATPAVAGEATVAFSAGGFTPTWTSSDATARRIGYLAGGDAAAAVTLNLSGSPALASVTSSGSLTGKLNLSGTVALGPVVSAGSLTVKATVSGSYTLAAILPSAGVSGFDPAAFSSDFALGSTDAFTVPGVGGGAANLSGSPTLASVTASGTIAAVASLSGSLTLANVTGSGTLTAPASLSGTVALAAVTPSGTLVAKASISGSPTLAAVTPSGTLTALASVSGSVSFGAVVSSGTFTVRLAVSGSPALASITSTGTLIVALNLFGSVTLAAVTSDGTLSAKASLSGAVTLGAVTPAGSFTVKAILAGSVALSPVIASGGFGAVAAQLSGSVALGSVTASFDASGFDPAAFDSTFDLASISAFSAIATLAGSKALSSVAASGALRAPATVTGTIPLGAVTASGTFDVVVIRELSGAISLALVASSGSLTVTSTLAGSIALGPITATGAFGVLASTVLLPQAIMTLVAVPVATVMLVSLPTAAVDIAAVPQASIALDAPPDALVDLLTVSTATIAVS